MTEISKILLSICYKRLILLITVLKQGRYTGPNSGPQSQIKTARGGPGTPTFFSNNIRDLMMMSIYLAWLNTMLPIYHKQLKLLELGW